MNPFDAIAPFYDLEHDGLTLDTTMYVALAKERKGDVMVLGVGTGRVAEPLVDAGFRVSGVDSSELMLERARQRLGGRKPAVDLVLADLRDFRFRRRFGLAIFPLDTFSLLVTQDAQISALSRVAAHLSPEGSAVIDVANPLMMPDAGQNDLERERFVAVLDGKRIRAVDRVHVDVASQLLQLNIRYEAEGGRRKQLTEVQLQIRYVYRYELEALARMAGLRAANTWGDYDRSGYVEDSPRLILEAVRG